MMKILIGLATAIVVAVGGFFGFQFYTQHRIASQVDAAFEQIRAAGGKASHGKVSFDLVNRTLDIADVVAETSTQPPLRVKIANLKAAGIRQPDPTRFAADTIETVDVEVGTGTTAPFPFQLTYSMPRFAVKDFSGPVSLAPMPAASAIDFYRSAIEQFTEVAASSVTAPTMTLAIDGGAMMQANDIYSGLDLRDIKDGKIASMKVDRVVITAKTQPPPGMVQPPGAQLAGKPQQFNGEVVNLAAYDLDATAAAAMLDPAKAHDDHTYRIYRQIAAGAYNITFNQGPNVRIDGFTIDDIGVRPSKLQLATLLSIIPMRGAPAIPPEQAREMIGNIASIYDGIRIGNAEIRGFSVDTPKGSSKLAAIRMNIDNGKLGELAIEGVDTPVPQGRLKVGRFALKSLDLANLVRMSTLFSNPAQKPSPDQLAGLLTLLQGVEAKDISAPFKNTGKPVTLDHFNLDWGQFVGPIPSRLGLAARMVTPVDASDPTAKPLVAMGLDALAIDCDVSTAWTEASQTLVLDAPALDVDGILKASARISFGNVPRQVFTLDPQQVAATAAQIEAGTIELKLRDVGGLDLLVRQSARAQNVNAEAARQAIVDSIRSRGATVATDHPDVAPAVDALAGFVQTPGQTLTIRLTPLSKLPALQLMQSLRTEPFSALAQFKIEVSTGL